MLWDSIKRNSQHNVQVILNANFPVDMTLNMLGISPLHLAASHSNKEILDTIMSFKPIINIRDSVNYKIDLISI